MIDLSDSQLQTLMSAERRVGAMLRMRGRFNDTDVADVAKLALAGLAADSVP